jgi:hypothetical protein
MDNSRSRVKLETSNDFLKRLFDMAEEKATKNIRPFGDCNVLVEGSMLYPNVWIETQPMGGEMYAKRNLEVALNNQTIFMDNQREDGRFPGMIAYENDQIIPSYGWMQGYCFPVPAYKMYFLAKLDDAYLKKLYYCLEKYDEYLWKYRDSDGDGCLETWCIWDTGEDESTRFPSATNFWAGEIPPAGNIGVPYESMDIMAYSYCGRYVLSLISDLLNNDKKEYWSEKAKAVRDKIHDYLWIDERHACFDRDKKNQFMDILVHNNIRAMHYGAFTQDMADRFIRHHVFNPEEFWTEMPLPSIAVNDPHFNNNDENDWSGQPEGLTYQRAIQAFENYGHYAELKLLGEKLINAVGEECRFTQQFDPFTAKPTSPGQDEYGPTIIAVLEYIARMYGIHIDENLIFWSGLQNENNTIKYSQEWFGITYSIENKEGTVKAFINNDEIISFSTGVRIVTDLYGGINKIIGIDTKTNEISVTIGAKKYSMTVNPNEVYSVNEDGEFILASRAPFDYPFRKTGE